VFLFRIALSVVSFLFLAGEQTPSSGPQKVGLPAWLAGPPDAREEQTHAGEDKIDVSYRVPRPQAEVIARYRDQLQKAEIRFRANFDGLGTVIRCSEGKASCVIQVRERDDGTSVKVSYSPNLAPSQTAFIVPPASASPTPAAPPPSAKDRPDDSVGIRQVEYSITGTVHVVSITYRNASGGTEQRRVRVPYRDTFFASPGAALYLSAQKTRFVTVEDGMIATREEVVDDGQAGTVHVRITCGGKIMQEAESSAPHGIATASGRVAP
jgi:hypothetical protein